MQCTFSDTNFDDVTEGIYFPQKLYLSIVTRHVHVSLNGRKQNMG